MGSIPLPALDARPPAAPPNMLEQYAQVMGLRNEMQMQPLRQQMAQAQIAGQQLSNQQTGLNLQDEKAASAAMREYYGMGGDAGQQPSAQPGGTGGSPSAATPGPQATAPTAPGAGMAQSASARLGGASGSPAAPAPPAASEVQQTRPFFDPTALGQLILKNGGSAKAVIGMQQLGLAMENTRAQVFKNLQQGNEAQVASTEKRVTAVADALSALRNVPDSQLAGAFQDKVDELNQEGLLDPAHLQFAQQIASIKDPAQQRAQIYRMDTAMMGSAQAIDLAKKQFDEMSARATSAEAQMALAYRQSHPGAPPAGVTAPDMELADWLQKHPGKGPADYQLWTSQHSPYALIMQNQMSGAQNQEALDFVANNYRQTGQMPPGLYRSPGTIQAIIARAAQLNQQAGGGDLASNRANFAANEASLRNLQKNYDQVQAFEQTASKNMDLLQRTAQKIPDLGSRFANIPVRSLNAKMLGTENMAAFNAALTTAQTEAAKVLTSANATGVLSDSSRHELQNIIDGNMPYNAMVASLNTLKQDMANRTQSYQMQIGDIQNRIKGSGAQPAGSGGGATASGSMTITLPSGKKITIE